MDKKELLKYGNELTICGFVVGNDKLSKIVMFPDENLRPGWDIETPNNKEIHQIIRQMDIQEIEGLQKVILRKSQRQIDQRVSWEVFRRDNFTCVYCGADDVPMTIDHIVLWEHMGDTVPNNLNCSCKKCNKTRGSMNYLKWMSSDYILSRVPQNHGGDIPDIYDLAARGVIAESLPLRKTKRSR